MMRIRYYGHVGQLTGFGRAAEATCMAITTIPGVELEIRALAPADQQLTFGPSALPLANLVKRDHEFHPNPDVVIVHTLPMDCWRVLEIARLVSFPVRVGSTGDVAKDCVVNDPVLDLGVKLTTATLVAYTTWEALTMPEAVVRSLVAFDQVWWPSHAPDLAFGRAQSRMQIEQRHLIVPHAFDVATLPQRQVRQAGDDVYRFYYIGAWNTRKNVHGLIRAYAGEFQASEPAELVIRSQGTPAEKLVAAIVSTGRSGGGCPRISFNAHQASEADILDLHRTADCYVTASHGEAWNLPMFDAMLAGRHILAPHGSGSDDYLMGYPYLARVESSLSPACVDVTVQQQPGGGFACQTVGAQGLTSQCRWLEPDLHKLAGAMRRAFDRRGDTPMPEELYDQQLHQEWLIDQMGYRAVGQKIHHALAQEQDRT